MSETHAPQFIEEMKARLSSEKMALEQELKGGARLENGDYQAKFPDYGRDEEDNATEVADYTSMSATTEALEERLASVNEALQRIEIGRYGITDSGELIPEARLRANPAAATTIKSK